MKQPEPTPDVVLSEVRLVELLAVLSLVSDLGMGQPMEHAQRQCLIAMRLADELGIDDVGRQSAYYSGLLAWVGCHVDSYEQAKWFGDEMAVKADYRHVDFSGPMADVKFLLGHIGQDRPFLERTRARVAFFAHGGLGDIDAMMAIHSDAVDGLAAGLGLSEEVRLSIQQTFERWDGRGDPEGLKGAEILLTSRLVNLADVVEVFHRIGGIDAATAVARERSGTQFDPEVVSVFCDNASTLFAELDRSSTWDTVIACDPALAEPLTDDALDEALGAIADFTDVKSPYTVGHSRGVAELTGHAAETLGLGDMESRFAKRAGYLHDLGRLGVSNSVWDKRGDLTVAESERMRMHPYLTERTLASSPALAAFGAAAAQHHERLDGSGYPRGIKRDDLSATGRILGAADFYRAKVEPRPHRPAMSPSDAAALLRSEVRAGKFDGDAVEAVLSSAGHRSRRRRTAVAGLTPREIEVLRLLAQGHSTKQVAHDLGISRKTAANHVEHIYAKLGVSNRAMATLVAAKHGLLDPDHGLA